MLGSAAFAGLGLLMAGTLRAEATLAVANGLYLVFLLLGGFILPLDRLPGPIGDRGARPAGRGADRRHRAARSQRLRSGRARPVGAAGRPGRWWPSAPRRSRSAPNKLRSPPAPRPTANAISRERRYSP